MQSEREVKDYFNRVLRSFNQLKAIKKRAEEDNKPLAFYDQSDYDQTAGRLAALRVILNYYGQDEL